MGWSNINGLELADEGLDAATNWFRNTSASWQKKEHPTAADWIKLLGDFAPGVPGKQLEAISRLSEKAMSAVPGDVKKETKTFAEKLDRLFKSEKQRDIKPGEFYLHALIVLSSEEGFPAPDTKVFDALLKAFKS